MTCIAKITQIAASCDSMRAHGMIIFHNNKASAFGECPPLIKTSTCLLKQLLATSAKSGTSMKLVAH